MWGRRLEQLSADKPGRLPNEMPRGNRDGPLDHWRRGLIGTVQDWAEGSRADAAKLIHSLIHRLELQDDLSELLHSSTKRQAETDAFIVDRFKAALGVLKACSTEQQQQEYRTALALIAPPRSKERDNSGMAYPHASWPLLGTGVLLLETGPSSTGHGARMTYGRDCHEARP